MVVGGVVVVRWLWLWLCGVLSVFGGGVVVLVVDVLVFV